VRHQRRHDTLSEFVQDLRHPNPAFVGRTRAPLIERHPVRFWKSVAVVLGLVVLMLLFGRFGLR